MNLSKNKIIAGVIGLVAVVGVVNTQAIVKLSKVNGSSYSQSAQVVKATTSYQAQQEYKKGDRSDVIQNVQKALTEQGFYKSDISGLFGPRTEAAVKAFQLTNRLPATGVLDLKTQDAILKINRGGGNDTILPPCGRLSDPWIRVTSPNGGEVYQSGQEINVTWASCKIPADTLLEINVNGSGVAMGFLAPDGTPNDGSEIITQDWPAGTYKITVGTPLYNLNNSALAIYDRSDNDFLIGGCAEGTIIGYNSDGTPIYCNNDNSPLVFTLLETNDDNATYVDLQNNDIGVFHFIFKIKNISNETVYMEKSCGTSESGLSVELINDQGQGGNPLGIMCSINWLGSILDTSNQIVINPNEETIATIVFLADPVVTPGNYRAVIDTVNYQTPSSNFSSNITGSVYPSIMMTNYRWIMN